MSFYYLAAISAGKNDYESALSFVESGLVKNSHNVKARGLKAMLLYKIDKYEECLNWISENLKLDAFDYVSQYIRIKIAKEKSGADDLIADFHRLTRDFNETYLMVARDLAESGFYTDAIEVLKMSPNDTPMTHYYLGAYMLKNAQNGAISDDNNEFLSAEKCDPYCCFPNKLEDIAVLESSIAANPGGAKAYYYLGCLYYDKLGFDKAIGLWEKARELDDTYPTLLRNLSIAYYNKRSNPEKARECIEKAFLCDKSDARIFLEMDQLYQRINLSLEERLKNYNDNIALIEKRDDLYTEYVTLLNTLGMYREAHDRITSHNFRTWEGAEGKISAQFKLSLFMLATEAFKASDYAKAKELLTEALSYPENLGEGKLEGTKDNNLYYLLGLVEKKLGNKDASKQALTAATLGTSEPAGMMYYYDQPADMILFQGLALQKSGDTKASNSRFFKLLDFGEQHLNDEFLMDYFAVSMPDMSVYDSDMNLKNKEHCYYLMGLANLGMGNPETARNWFKKVRQLERSHQLSQIYLAYMSY